MVLPQMNYAAADITAIIFGDHKLSQQKILITHPYPQTKVPPTYQANGTNY